MGWNHYRVLTLAMLATPVWAYPIPVDVDGNLHAWPVTIESPVVYYEVFTTDEGLKPYMSPVVDASARLWTDVERSAIKLEPATIDHPAQITVNYDTTIAGGDTAAGYSIFDAVENGVPIHCSVHIAADGSSDFEALHKTTLHELGHCLGLSHSLIANSIMSYHLEVNSFALSLDDEAAISRLYPIDGSKPKLAPGCAIGRRILHPPQPLVLIVLLLAPGIPLLWNFFLRERLRI